MKGLDYLESLEVWSGRGGFNLDSIKAVLRELDNPQDSYRTIHVGGTNGKGSVAAFISSIFGSDGLKVGLQTSPHLSHFTERIIVDGFPVSLEQLEPLLIRLHEVSDTLKLKLSYHEGITALSFMVFQELKVDIAVIEVGLGGRLDASNVISKPDCTIITSISLDHTDILGPCISSIAIEKAGILRRGVPLVCGNLSKEALEVIEAKARELHSPIYILGRDFKVAKETGVISSNSRELLKIEPSLRGEHQLYNGAIAAYASHLAGATKNGCEKGVKEVFWPGRLESLEYNESEILLDCAHNVEGFQSLANYLKEKIDESIPIIFGALDTKDWHAGIDLLVPFAKKFLILEPKSNRAVSCSEIENYLSKYDISCSSFASDYEACLKALKKQPLTLACGSIYMVGELRMLIEQEKRPLWKRYNNV